MKETRAESFEGKTSDLEGALTYAEMMNLSVKELTDKINLFSAQIPDLLRARTLVRWKAKNPDKDMSECDASAPTMVLKGQMDGADGNRVLAHVMVATWDDNLAGMLEMALGVMGHESGDGEELLNEQD